MKKITALSLFVFALTLGITSCSKNDDAPADPMLGYWVMDKYTSTKSGETSEPKDYTSPDCAPVKSYIDLKSSSVLEMGSVDPDCKFSQTPGTWELADKVLKLKGTGAASTMNFTVISVSASTMVLKMTSSDAQNYYTINLVKQ